MRASELLSALPDKGLRDTARAFGFKSTKVSKMSRKQLIDLLIQGYANNDEIAKQWEKLSQTQKDLLTYLCMFTTAYTDGTERFQLDRIHFVRNINQTINTLCKKGILFEGEDHHWQPILYVPEELFSFLMEQELSILMKKKRKRKAITEKIQSTGNYGLAAAHDMMSILSSIAHESIGVTKEGRIYKRQMKKLNEKCRLSSDLFNRLSVLDDYQNIDFWQGFLEETGLIDHSADTSDLWINEERLEQFMRCSYLQWMQTFFDYYLVVQSYYDRASLPTNLCIVLLFHSGMEWELKRTSYELINTWCRTWNIGIDESSYNYKLYHPLLLFGLIETGRNSEDEELWRWSEWGKEWARFMIHLTADGEIALLTEDLYVQPNLEIIVPENILPAIRWRVETFAELKSSDTVLIYEWSRNRLEQAAEAGWTLTEAERFFTHYSKNPIPANVLQTLKDWMERFGKAKLWDVLVLEVQEEVAPQLQKNKALQKLIVMSFSATTFVIHRRDERQVRATMQSLGIPVLRSVSSPDSMDERVSGDLSTDAMNQHSYAPQSLKGCFDKEAMKGNELIVQPLNNDNVDDPDDEFFF